MRYRLLVMIAMIVAVQGGAWAAVDGIETDSIEIRPSSGVYDDTIRITRNADDELVFYDSANPSGARLRDLKREHFVNIFAEGAVTAGSYAGSDGVVRVPSALAGGSSGAAGSPAANELLWGGNINISHPSTMELLTLESTADNTSGIVMCVNRLRPAGANDDAAFVLGVQANDEAGGTALVSTISTSLADASEAAMTSRIVMQTMQAGTLADRFLLDGDIVRVLGKLAGGSSGAAGSPAANELLWGGSVNATQLFAGVSTKATGSFAAQFAGPIIVGGKDAGGYIAFQSPSIAGPVTTNWGRIQCGSSGMLLDTNKTGTGTTTKVTISREGEATFHSNASSTGHVRVGGNLSVGFETAASARLHAIATTEQMRLGYNASNYASFTVGSTGNLAVAPTGTNTTISGTLGVGGTYDDGRLHVLGSNSGDLVVAKLENSSNAGSAITRLLMELGTSGIAANIALGFSGSPYMPYMRFGIGSADEQMRLTPVGLGIGTGAHPSAKLHVVSTTEQLRLGYDASNYVKQTVAADGAFSVLTEGTDADLTIGTKNNASAIFIDESAGSLSLNAAHVLLKTANFYQHYDAINYLKLTVASDGAATLTAKGIDPDFTISTPSLPSVIHIDDSAGALYLDATQVFLETANFYQRYDTNNYFKLDVASDGAATLTAQGTDPDFTISTPSLPNAIHIDDSAGSVGFGTDEPDSSTVAHFNGDVLVDGDLTVTDRVGGAPVVLTASYAASQAVSSVVPGLMLLGDVQIGGSPTSKGFVAHRSGSIVGISIIYDVTKENGPLAMFSSVNGLLKSSTDISSTVGASKTATATFNRGKYTFSAGDVIRWGIRVTSGGPTTVNDVICSLEIIYD